MQGCWLQMVIFGHFQFFDEIDIEDPRVHELCLKTTEPLPHQVLLTCIQRNFGLNELNVTYNTKTLGHGKNEFNMVVGEYSVTVECMNKKEGKQKAAQALLQVAM